jgi:hypothetical protein
VYSRYTPERPVAFLRSRSCLCATPQTKGRERGRPRRRLPVSNIVIVFEPLGIHNGLNSISTIIGVPTFDNWAKASIGIGNLPILFGQGCGFDCALFHHNQWADHPRHPRDHDRHDHEALESNQRFWFRFQASPLRVCFTVRQQARSHRAPGCGSVEFPGSQRRLGSLRRRQRFQKRSVDQLRDSVKYKDEGCLWSRPRYHS